MNMLDKIPSGIPLGCQTDGSKSGRHFVGPDLGPNCLQRLSADDNSR